MRKDYAADMKSSDVARQQKGVTVYLIDRLALRVGGEKDTDEEADTVRRRVSRGWPVGRGGWTRRAAAHYSPFTDCLRLRATLHRWAAAPSLT